MLTTENDDFDFMSDIEVKEALEPIEVSSMTATELLEHFVSAMEMEGSDQMLFTFLSTFNEMTTVYMRILDKESIETHMETEQ